MKDERYKGMTDDAILRHEHALRRIADLERDLISGAEITEAKANAMKSEAAYAALLNRMHKVDAEATEYTAKLAVMAKDLQEKLGGLADCMLQAVREAHAEAEKDIAPDIIAAESLACSTSVMREQCITSELAAASARNEAAALAQQNIVQDDQIKALAFKLRDGCPPPWLIRYVERNAKAKLATQEVVALLKRIFNWVGDAMRSGLAKEAAAIARTLPTNALDLPTEHVNVDEPTTPAAEPSDTAAETNGDRPVGLVKEPEAAPHASAAPAGVERKARAKKAA